MCGADNGLRRPSKATGIRVVPKYRKIRNGPFAVFSAGKMETSDFFEGKFRGFALKVRMFVLEKSDVFRRKQGGKAVFFPVFREFSPCFPPYVLCLCPETGAGRA